MRHVLTKFVQNRKRQVRSAQERDFATAMEKRNTTKSSAKKSAKPVTRKIAPKKAAAKKAAQPSKKIQTQHDEPKYLSISTEPNMVAKNKSANSDVIGW